MFGKNAFVVVLFNDIRTRCLCNFMGDNKLLSKFVIICYK